MSKCGATIKTQDKRTLVCALDAEHPGPVHKDANGEQWGDIDLRPEPSDESA